MKQLEKEFIGIGEVKGFKFLQLAESDKAYIYKVTNIDEHYEVFKKIINKRYNCISYPRSASFGQYAWCILDKQKAFEKFNEISI